MTTSADTSFSRTLPLSSDPELARRFMVIDEPLRGNLRFGLLLEFLDKVAEETALAYVNRFFPDARVVTAAIDNILVRHVADVSRDIVFLARVNHVGRSSMEVGIRVEHGGEVPNHVASCYFTMVARTGTGEVAESVPLPPLEPGDEVAAERRGKAELRRKEYRRREAASREPPTGEEYSLLYSLHMAQEDPSFRGLLAGRLVTDAWERMYPEQENVPRKIFGGYLVRRAYELSSICCDLAAPDRAIAAAVNRINFLQPVRMGDKLHYTARVVCSRDAFVCVEAGIERISRDRTTHALSNSCLFTFVNVGPELDHRPVPPVYPTTYAEDARFLAARRSLEEVLRHRALV
jgi:acyl-CoA hydrolase